MNIFSKILRYRSLVLICAGLLAIATYFICFFCISVNFDASYYLGSARLLLDGKIPYVDFKLGYPPMAYYILIIPFSLIDDSFETGLATGYMVLFVDAILLVWLLLKLTADRMVSFFGFVFFLLLSLCFDGMFVSLESYVLLFGLGSLIALQYKGIIPLMIAGSLSICSMWCKQYGFGFVCLTILYTLIVSKRKFRDVICVFIGIVLTLTLLIGLIILGGAQLNDMMDLNGSGYAKAGFNSLLSGIGRFSYRTLIFVPILLFAMWKFKRVFREPLAIISVFGIIGFLLPCYVRCYDHYLMLAMPFVIILSACCYKNIEPIQLRNVFVLIMYLALCLKCWTVGRTAFGIYRSDEKAHEQLYAQKVAKLIPTGEKDVFLSLWAIPLQHINRYTPPLLKKYGLSNGFEMNKEKAKEYLHNSSYLVIDSYDYDGKSGLDDGAVLKILSDGFCLLDSIPYHEDGMSYVYKKK